MSTLSLNEVQQVARLARLQLDDKELATLATQLDTILTYVQQLQRVPTDGVEPTTHVLPLSNVMRADETQSSVTPERVLALAPARHGQLFKVPKIVET